MAVTVAAGDVIAAGSGATGWSARSLFEVSGDLYAVTQDSKLHVWKSTDDGATWAEQDAANAPTVSSSAYPFSMSPRPSALKIGYFSSANTVRVRQFTIATGLWAATDDGNANVTADAANYRPIRLGGTDADGAVSVALTLNSDDADMMTAFRTTGAWTAHTLPLTDADASTVVHSFDNPSSFAQRFVGYDIENDDLVYVIRGFSNSSSQIDSAAAVGTANHTSLVAVGMTIGGNPGVTVAYSAWDNTIRERTAVQVNTSYGTQYQVTSSTDYAGGKLSTCQYDGDRYVFASNAAGTSIDYWVFNGSAWVSGGNVATGTGLHLSQALPVAGTGIIVSYQSGANVVVDWAVDGPGGGAVNDSATITQGTITASGQAVTATATVSATATISQGTITASGQSVTGTATVADPGPIFFEGFEISAANTGTADTPSGLTVGDVLIALASGLGAIAVPGFTTVSVEESNYGTNMAMLVRVVDGSEGGTITATSGDGYMEYLALAHFSGVDATTPMTGTPSFSEGLTTPVVVPAVVTGADDAMLIAFSIGSQGPGAPANPTGIIDDGSVRFNANSWADGAFTFYTDQLGAAGSSGTRTFDLSGAASTKRLSIIMAALRPYVIPGNSSGTVSVGAITTSGQSVTSTFGVSDGATVSAGTIATSGQSVSASFTVSADATITEGTAAATGEAIAATFGQSASATVSPGTVNATGESVTATATTSATATITAGTIAATGESVTASAGVSVSATVNPGAIAASGQTVTSTAGGAAFGLIDPGTIAATGQSITASFTADATAIITPGTLAASGQSVAASAGGSVTGVVQVGTLAASGLMVVASATVSASGTVNAGAIVASGYVVTVTAGQSVTATIEPGTIVATGYTVFVGDPPPTVFGPLMAATMRGERLVTGTISDQRAITGVMTEQRVLTGRMRVNE